MNIFKQIIKKRLNHFTYFYTHLGYRVFVALGLSLSVGVLDGFGLAMFLPLLQMVSDKAEASAEGLGNLRFLVELIESLGFNLTVTTVLIVILTFFTLKGIAKFFEAFNKVLVQQYFIKKLRFNSVDRLSNFSFKAFVTADSGRIQNTLSGEVGRVAQAYQAYFAAVQASVLIMVYLTLALLSNPQFAVLVMIGGALSNTLYRKIYKETKATSSKITNIGHYFQGLLIQMVAYFKYLKATGFNDTYAAKLKATIVEIEKNNKKIGFYNALLAATREPLVILVVVCVIIIQVTYFSESLGLIILSLLFFYRSLTYVMIFQSQWNQFLNLSGSLENMTEFMHELSENQERSGQTVFRKFTNSIKIIGLSFNYGDVEVLKRLNLTIQKNTTVAFVGESGSGKTTLVNIITGLMPIDYGQMLIDGIPADRIQLASFRKRVGYITQEPVVFNDSVYNNVTFWDEKNPENLNKFWLALKKAAIDEFVRGLSENEDTILGTAGSLISGGQKQRLSIARELYKDIDILIMDEATSALDSETEKVIQENINALKGQYTILIVAHRLSTIKEADAVVLLNKGEINSIGNFEELITSSEKFRRMASIQEL